MNRKLLSDSIFLKILEHIQEEPTITQRDLASKLGIALGLTNAYLKRLVKKGYIKIKNLTGKRIMYILTPKGMVEKARLTFNYMTRSFSYFKEIKNKIDKTYSVVTSSGEKIFFYGALMNLLSFVILHQRELP